MKAIIVSKLGPPEVMQYLDVPMPTFAHNEVLVEVKAIGVNRVDLIQREGPYVAPPGNKITLGIELAGIVTACGADVTNFSPGDKVFGYVNGGAYAEYCSTDAKLLNPLPENWSFQQGASVAEAFQVAYENLFTECNLQKCRTLFAYAGASSLGIAIIQLAKQNDNRVIVTAGTPEKCKFCLSLGADHAINYKKNDVVTEINKFTNGEGVDLIVDPVGPVNLAQDIECLKPDSTILMNGTLGGNEGILNIIPFAAKRVTLRTYNTRGRTPEYQHEIVQRFQNHSLPLLSEGIMKMPIDITFPLEEVAKAHAYMEADKNIGKVILTVTN